MMTFFTFFLFESSSIFYDCLHFIFFFLRFLTFQLLLWIHAKSEQTTAITEQNFVCSSSFRRRLMCCVDTSEASVQVRQDRNQRRVLISTSCPSLYLYVLKCEWGMMALMACYCLSRKTIKMKMKFVYCMNESIQIYTQYFGSVGSCLLSICNLLT